MAIAGRRESLGIHLYGAAAVVLGAIQLVHGDFSMNWHPARPGLPLRSMLVYVTGICWIAGGLAAQWRRTSRIGVGVVGVLFFFGALLWLPRVIGFPQLFGTWAGFAEEFAPAVAALIAYLPAATVAPPLRETSSTAPAPRRAVAVFLFGLSVAALGLAHFFALEQTASMVPAWIPPGQRFWAIATGLAMLLAGIGILSRVRSVLAAQLLAALLGTFALVVWLPRLATHPTAPNAWGGTAITIAVASAAWMVADALRHSAVADTRTT
jgi:uncharacterized membrane protein